MKIYTKVLLIILLIGLAQIEQIETTRSSFRASFGLRKKSNSRNQNSNSVSTRTRTNKKKMSTPTKFFAVSTAITASKEVKKTEGNTTTSTTRSGDIPDHEVYYDGWVKYLRYTDMKVQKPKAFFKNTRFAPQSRAKFPLPEYDDVRFYKKYFSITIIYILLIF